MQVDSIDITTRDGVRLKVNRYLAEGEGGDKEPHDLLLLHGWPNAGRVWKPLAGAMLRAGSGFRIYAPDLRGYGESEHPTDGYRCATFAEDVADIAQGLGLTLYTLVGHSMSGKIAQLAAARYPEGLASLALITPGLLAASPPVDVTGRKAMYGNELKVRDMLTGWAAHPLPAEIVTMLTEDALRASRDAWIGWLSPMRDEDFAEETGNIHVPTLVVGGGRDPQRTEEELRRGVVLRIAGAEYARLPNSGHLPHLEEPDALALLLVNFLEGVIV